MLSQFLLLLILVVSALSTIPTTPRGCEHNTTSYPIDAEWTLAESCQTCKCLTNQIIICRNRTCQLLKDCPMGEQLTIKPAACCPVCAPVRRSCLYDDTALLHNTVFYPKSCLQCRCRDGQLFCDNTCRPASSQANRCSFDNEFHEINAVWSPLSCVRCQCKHIPSASNATAVCYIKQCPSIQTCRDSLQFIPGRCCPVCRASVCYDQTGLIHQNGDVWSKTNNCTHCKCQNGVIICTEETCPVLKCQSNEKLVRLPNSCCSICSNRHLCRFHGNKGYQIFYEHDLWYTSACQYCTCRRHNRIICKSVQCEHQFCLEHEIQEARSDSCCVSCRQAKQCFWNGHILKEGSYSAVNNCTLCTCTSTREPACYSNCRENGYETMQFIASGEQRNHTITITDSLATIISYSKFGSMPSTSDARSLLFQFLPPAATPISNAAVLLGIVHNLTGHVSYRLILIDFDSTKNRTTINRRLSDELRLWTPLTNATPRMIRSSISVLEEEKHSDQIVLIILIIILALICIILILIIIFLCYRRKQKTPEPITSKLKRPGSAVSIVEKFQAPDLTTKVTLLAHFPIAESDLGTDV